MEDDQVWERMMDTVLIFVDYESLNQPSRNIKRTGLELEEIARLEVDLGAL